MNESVLTYLTGTTPDGRKTLVIWRQLPGEPEHDKPVLDA